MTSYSKVTLDSNLWFNTKLIHGWPPQARSPAPVVLVAASDGPLGDTACLVGWEINGKCFVIHRW